MNYDTSDRRSFIINLPPKEVVKILGKEFKKSRNFIVKKEGTDEPIWILKCHDNFRNFVIIAIGTYYKNKNQCILSTVAFRKDITWISKSETATAMNSSIIFDIKSRITEINSKVKFTPLDKLDDFVSVKAFGYIQSETQSKINILYGFFQRITPFFRRAIFITIVIFFILSVLSSLLCLDVNNYITIIIPIILALIIEVGIPLKDELSIKKVDEFN